MPTKICPVCGTKFKISASRYKRYIFCSKNCRGNFPYRFWKKVEKNGKDDCWPWMAAKCSFGYGVISWNQINTLAHRISWQLHVGPIPDGLCVLHHCDNPACVNPDHLFVDTKAKNTEDMMLKGRNRYSTLRGEECTTSKLTDDKVKEIRFLYASKNISFRKLGDMFCVHPSTIEYAIKRKTWAHI